MSVSNRTYGVLEAAFEPLDMARFFALGPLVLVLCLVLCKYNILFLQFFLLFFKIFIYKQICDGICIYLIKN